MAIGCGTSHKNARQTELVRYKNITVILYIVFRFYSKFIKQGISDNFQHYKFINTSNIMYIEVPNNPAGKCLFIHKTGEST